MAKLSRSQLYGYAQAAGFRGLAADIIVAIALAESAGGNTLARNCNNPGGSCDRGILQINNYWHSEVSDACAYDPGCAFRAAFRISGGWDFHQWVTYTTGAFRAYLTSGPPSGGGTPAGPPQPGSSGPIPGQGACPSWAPQWLCDMLLHTNYTSSTPGGPITGSTTGDPLQTLASQTLLDIWAIVAAALAEVEQFLLTGAVKGGFLLLAVIVVLFGLYLLFKEPIDSAAGGVTKAGATAALAA